MPTQESANVLNGNDGPPPTLGQSLIALPRLGIPAHTLLERAQSAWHSVASWGTWRDEELGDWPTLDVCVSEMPEWFRNEVLLRPTFSMEAWLSDLHDREWVWWNASVQDSFVKIDLDSQSLPISTWMLEVVIEAAGGKVVYRDRWVSLDEAATLEETTRPVD